MISADISVYRSYTKRADIIMIESWQPLTLFCNLLLILNIVTITNRSKIYIYKKSFPGSRFPFICILNEAIFQYAFKIVFSRFLPIRILWIKNPHYYGMHNSIKSDVLIFDCKRDILLDQHEYIYYKKCFLDGWIFAYLIHDKPQTIVFKNRTEKDIVQTLSHM